MTETLTSTCRSCGNYFTQPYDPGKRKEYCSNACRQRAYRARGGRASGTRQESAGARQRRQEQDAWAREQARREQERERSERRRRESSQRPRRGQEQIKTPAWTHERSTDDARTAKVRRTARLLYARANHEGTPAAEADACRERADAMRAKYKL